MITEDYVSFEIAKLLKENGFNGLCTAYYDCFTTDNFHCGSEPTDFNSIDTKIRNIVAAPTLQTVMKWLREVHNIAIETEQEHWWYAHIKPMTSKPSEEDYYQCVSSKYEEACESAIKYCLKNLIGMRKEEKELLLKDLCARLPYGVKVNVEPIHSMVPKYDSLLWGFLFSENLAITEKDGNTKFFNITDIKIKPYLRPMSSMTEEERKTFKQLQEDADEAGTFEGDMLLYDWLNKNHFDYRLLIFQGLAIEAPEGMYKIE